MSTLKVGDIKHESFTGTTQLKLDSAGRVLVGTDTKGQADADDLTIANSGSGGISIRAGASHNANIFFSDATSGSAEYAGYLQYKHNHDRLDFGTATSTRMTLDSSGRLLLGTTTEGHENADNLTLEDSAAAGITLRSASNNSGGVFFSDGTSGAAEYAGILQYDHASNYMRVYTDGSERMRITSSGQLLIGTTSTSGVSASSDDIVIGSIGDSTYRGITFATTSEAAIRWADAGDNAMGRIEYSNSNDKMTLHTSNAERIRIGSSGFVGIGQGSSYDPGAPLEVRNPAGTTPSSGVLNLLRLCAQHNSARGLDIGTGRPTSGNQNDGGVFYNARDTESSGYSAQHVFQRAGNNVMVIGYAGGNTVGIGTDYPLYKIDCHHSGANQSNAAVSRFRQLTNNQGQDHACIIVRHAAARSGQNGVGLIFQNDGGSNVGRIDIGQSTTGYETSSDYRLKENVEAISDGITRLKTLKPYRFNWIAEKGQPKVDGFFAHEVTSAVPEAIRGTKDEVETTYYEKGDTIPDGKAVGDVKSTTSPVYQGIDQSKLVPLLVAALQEAVGKIETLETKVAALEAK